VWSRFQNSRNFLANNAGVSTFVKSLRNVFVASAAMKLRSERGRRRSLFHRRRAAKQPHAGGPRSTSADTTRVSLGTVSSRRFSKAGSHSVSRKCSCCLIE
jgi:hypothetical protein